MTAEPNGQMHQMIIGALYQRGRTDINRAWSKASAERSTPITVADILV